MKHKLEHCKGGASLMRKQLFRWSLVTIWLILTVYLSQQTGTESAAMSGWLAHSIYHICDVLGINLSYAVLHMVLRKIAHFGIHFVLAWLGYRAMLISCEKKHYAIIATVVLYGIIAVFDELIQGISPGRVLMLGDLLINLSGIVLGVIIGVTTTKQQK